MPDGPHRPRRARLPSIMMCGGASHLCVDELIDGRYARQPVVVVRAVHTYKPLSATMHGGAHMSSSGRLRDHSAGLSYCSGARRFAMLHVLPARRIALQKR